MPSTLRHAAYTSAAYFGMFAPDLGFNPKAIIAWRPDHGCGVCMDCEDEVRFCCGCLGGG